jgi:hypothetical protein
MISRTLVIAIECPRMETEVRHEKSNVVEWAYHRVFSTIFTPTFSSDFRKGCGSPSDSEYAAGGFGSPVADSSVNDLAYRTTIGDSAC